MIKLKIGSNLTYRVDLSGPILDFAMKNYESRRSLPPTIVDAVTVDLEKHQKEKAERACKK